MRTICFGGGDSWALSVSSGTRRHQRTSGTSSCGCAPLGNSPPTTDRRTRSKDGLYGYGYQRYGFVLIENLTSLTANHTFRGSGQPRYGLFDNYADMLTTSGDTVELYIAPDRPSRQ